MKRLLKLKLNNKLKLLMLMPKMPKQNKLPLPKTRKLPQLKPLLLKNKKPLSKPIMPLPKKKIKLKKKKINRMY